MKICIIAEGCYPYVVGGVSSWIHSMIKSFPEYEFVLIAIVADRSFRGKFAYELPDNLTSVYEVYLQDKDWGNNKDKKHRFRLSSDEYMAVRSIVLNQKVEWEQLFKLFAQGNFSIDELLMGPDFLSIVTECYEKQYPHIVFSDFLWTMRSIYLPLFLVLKTDIPKADLYHCVATGYAGIIGCMGKYLNKGSNMLISEHGIYTREREEELIKAGWVAGIYKNIWIDQFKKMSLAAYNAADVVTSLYDHARDLQIELGCPPEKTMVTPNGINTERLSDIAGKTEEDEGYINVGAVLRITPIKDVKSMIQAYAFAVKKVPNLKLWIMGPGDEDKEYSEECYELVDMLGLKNVVFTGRIDVKDYLGRMDFTILTSISEGQPLTILESFAAHKPVIATDVGNCRELIYGSRDDNFGTAGILTHIMNIEEIANAMVLLATDEKMRITMGEAGYNRAMNGFRLQDMKNIYSDIYKSFERGK